MKNTSKPLQGGNIIKRHLMANRQSVMPIATPRTHRAHEISNYTTMPVGKIVPMDAIVLMREDQLLRGGATFTYQMHETPDIIKNAVNVTCRAIFVPFLAFERFGGSMDAFNRSYMGEPLREGEQPIPFFETEERGTVASNPIMKYMGRHAKPTDQVSTMYVEAYNLAVNYLLKNTSLNLPQRARLDKTLAKAFWRRDGRRHLVPDFDQALQEAEVALRVAEARIPVEGIGFKETMPLSTQTANLRESDGDTHSKQIVTPGVQGGHIGMEVQTIGGQAFPNIFADLPADSIKVLLSDIETAKKTQFFAKLRERFNGHDDEWIIEMLMRGLTVTDQHLKQPIVLATEHTVFGQSKRYASDGANMTKSMVNGATQLDIRFSVPRVPTGGVVIITSEILPDPLFERQEDPFLFTSQVSDWPDFLRDEQDPEKVDIVKCRRLDTDHATPDALLGYEPLNARFNIIGSRIGGEFYRATVSEQMTEDRMGFWPADRENPTLNEDFYVATEVDTSIFADTVKDSFRVLGDGLAIIQGNTVFGPALIEASDNYQQVAEVVPADRIEKD